jgi:hypothetical protein
MVAPPAGSLPLLRWAWGPLSVPYRPGTLHTGIKSIHGVGNATTSCHMSLSSGPRLLAKEGSGANTCLATPDHVSPLGRDLALPRVSWLYTPPPHYRGLRCYHVSHRSRPHLLTEESSSSTTCPTTPDPISPLERALALPCIPWLSIGHDPQE